jgi:hypothetical protein
MVSAGNFAPIVVQTTACGGAGSVRFGSVLFCSVLFVGKSWEASLWTVLRKGGYILLYSFDWLKVPGYSFGTLLRVCFLFVR